MAQPAPKMVPMVGPDGSSGIIPEDRVPDAVAAGFKPPIEAPLAAQAESPAARPELPQEETMVPMVGPDGTKGLIPESKAAEAIAAGFKRSGLAESPKEDTGLASVLAPLREATLGRLGQTDPNAVEQTPEARAPAVATPGAAGAVQAAIGGAFAQGPEQLRQQEATEAAHPTASTVGDVLQFGLGAGPLGAASSAVTKAAKLTGLAKTVVEGAIWGTPTAAEKLINGDPAAAAEALAFSVAGNVGLHAVFSAGSRLLAPAAKLGVEEASKIIGDVVGQKGEAINALADHMAPLMKDVGLAENETRAGFIKKINAAVDADKTVGKAYEAIGKAPLAGEELQGALRKSVEDLQALPGAEESGVKKIADKLGELDRKKDLTWRDARDLKKWLRELPEEAEAAVAKEAPRVARTGAEIAEYLKAHPDIPAGEALQNPGKFPDVFSKPGEALGQEAQASSRAIADAKDIVHANLMTAQNALVEQLGPKAGAAVVEGLKREGAVYAAEKIMGSLEKIPSAKGGSIFSDVHLLGYRHNPILMAAHLFGGHLGITVPFHAGVLAFKVARQAVKNAGEARQFGEALRVLRGSSAPNTSMALDALKALDTRMGASAKGLLASLTAREAFKHADAVNTSIGRFLPNGGSGQSRASQVEVLRRAASLHMDDPGAVADHLGTLTAPLHHEGLSPVADAYTQHQLRLMKVIQSVLPQDPKLSSPHPFASDVKSEEISPAIKARYERTLTIASDPERLVGFVKANTITPTDVAVAAATNPASLQKLRQALVEEAIKTKPDLSYQQRLSMSVLMGEDLDAATKATVATLQSSYGQPANAPVGPRQGVQNKGMNAKGQDNFLESSLTTSQRSIVGER